MKYPNIRLNGLETLGPGPGAAAGRSRESRGIKRYGFAIRPISCIVKYAGPKKSAQKKLSVLKTFWFKNINARNFHLRKQKLHKNCTARI